MFPSIPPEKRLRRLALLGRKVSVVIDTDPYNEIDDQFAIVYALLSPERLDVQAIYAAPFANHRSNDDPGFGMQRSFETANEVLDKLGAPNRPPVYRGAARFMTTDIAGFEGEIVESEAVHNLIERAMRQPDDEPLYVTAVAAITNVASALLLEPRIVDKVVVVWLAGHPHNYHETNEFNLRQDIYASRVVLDCGVPLVMMPCFNVAEHLLLTTEDVANRVRGRGEIGNYLADEFDIYAKDRHSLARPIWDMAPFAWLVNPGAQNGSASAVETAVIPGPLLTVSPLRKPDFIGKQGSHCTWGNDPRRPFIAEAYRLNRDRIFEDFYSKLDRFTSYAGS